MKGFILKETVMLWTRNTKMCCIKRADNLVICFDEGKRQHY